LIGVSARVLELHDLAVIQVAQTQSARSGDENVQHRPAQVEATRLTWEAAIWRSSPLGGFQTYRWRLRHLIFPAPPGRDPVKRNGD
jgi:hypothetical protein